MSISIWKANRLFLPLIICVGAFLLAVGKGKWFDERAGQAKSRVTVVSATPITVRPDKYNKGQVCPNYTLDEQYQNSSEYQHCLMLQEKLNHAAGDGDLDEMRDALMKGANPRVAYLQEGTPLSLGITKGRLEAVKLLVDNGADVNENPDGFTPLKTAASYGFIDIAEYLLDRGADICLRKSDNSYENANALDIAKAQHQESMVEFLEGKGADKCP